MSGLTLEKLTAEPEFTGVTLEKLGLQLASESEEPTPEVEERRPSTDEVGPLEAAGRGLAHGVMGVGESLATGMEYLGGKVGSEGLMRGGEIVGGYLREKAKPFEAPTGIQGNILSNPELMTKGSWWTYHLADMAPSFAAMMVPGMAADKYIKVAGQSLKLTSEVIGRLAKIGSLTAAGVAGGGMEGASTYQEILKRGGSREDAEAGLEAMTLAAGALNSIGFGKITGKLGTKKSGAILRFLKSGSWEGLTEYLEEPAEVLIKRGILPEIAFNKDEAIEQLKAGVNVIPIAGVMGGGAGVVFEKVSPEKIQDVAEKTLTEDKTYTKNKDQFIEQINKGFADGTVTIDHVIEAKQRHEAKENVDPKIVSALADIIKKHDEVIEPVEGTPVAQQTVIALENFKESVKDTDIKAALGLKDEFVKQYPWLEDQANEAVINAQPKVVAPSPKPEIISEREIKEPIAKVSREDAELDEIKELFEPIDERYKKRMKEYEHEGKTVKVTEFGGEDFAKLAGWEVMKEAEGVAVMAKKGVEVPEKQSWEMTQEKFVKQGDALWRKIIRQEKDRRLEEWPKEAKKYAEEIGYFDIEKTKEISTEEIAELSRKLGYNEKQIKEYISMLELAKGKTVPEDWHLAHEIHIKQALKSGELTPKKYAELHEEDYGPLGKFMPEMAKKGVEAKVEKPTGMTSEQADVIQDAIRTHQNYLNRGGETSLVLEEAIESGVIPGKLAKPILDRIVKLEHQNKLGPVGEERAFLIRRINEHFDDILREKPKPKPTKPKAVKAKVEKPKEDVILFNDLNERAKGAIASDAMSKGQTAEEFINSEWIHKTVDIESLKDRNKSVWSDSFVYRGSKTKGPLIIAADGEILDGNNRLREAIEKNDKQIDILKQLKKPKPKAVPKVEKAPSRLEKFKEKYPEPKKEIETIFVPAGKRIFAPISDKKAESLSLKEQKAYFVAEIDRAIVTAPEEATGEKVIIEVPGDGIFTVANSKDALQNLKKATKYFPTVEKPKPPKVTKPSMRPTGKRIKGEDVEYYNEFKPRKQGLIEGKRGKRQYYRDSFFTQGDYAVKLSEKPKTKYPTLIGEEAPSLESYLPTKGLKEAKLVGEFWEGLPEGFSVKAHVKTKDGTDIFLNANYVDVILTKYPDAKPYAKDAKTPVVFKEGKEFVGMVMPLDTEVLGGIPKSLQARAEEITGIKAKPKKEPLSETKSRLLANIKSEKGSSELMGDLSRLGADAIKRGHESFKAFSAEMKTTLGDAWEKVKHLMRDAYEAAKKILASERGAIEIGKEKPTGKQELPVFMEEFLKDVPSKTPPKTPSLYEKQKDDWFGNKDWAEFRNAVEKDKLQDIIKNEISETTNIFGKKIFDEKCKDVDRAIHIYLDLKRNPGHLAEFYEKLTKEQQKTVDLAQTIEGNPKLKALADYINNEYEKIGAEALSADVIRNVIDNYVGRVWKMEDKITTDVMQKFKTSSRHAKQRVFETILEGQAAGYELQITRATSNLNVLKDEIARVIEDKKLIKEMRKTKRQDGSPLLSTYKIHNTDRKIEHPNFKVWEFATKVDLEEKEVDKASGLTVGDFVRARDRNNIGKVVAITDNSVDVHFVNKKEGTEATVSFAKEDDIVGTLKESLTKVKPKGRNFFIADDGTIFEKRGLYAPEDIAKDLNKILGVSRLKGVWGVDTLTKYNAIFKSWILVTSFFHHQAFLRSYYLPTQHKTKAEMRPVKTYEAGKKAIKEFRPELELLVRNGLTMFKMQDWEESVLRQEDTIFGKILDKTTTTKAIKDKINDLRERQANFLFGNFGAALKAQAALIELRNMTRRHPEMDVNERAKMVGRIINDDFGGLHLGRMGRDPTIQHIMRLGLLAPDWCFLSNIRVLGKNGWKYYNEIKVGDEILAFNKDTQTVQWEGIKDIYINDKYDGPMVNLHNHGRDICMTPDHRCYVYNKKTKNYETVLASDLQPYHKIPRCAPNGYESPEEQLFSNTFVKLVGWFVSDGYTKKCVNQLSNGSEKEYRYGKITQSKPHTVEIIKTICAMKYHTEKPSLGGINKDGKRIIGQYPKYTFTVPKHYFQEMENLGLCDGLNWEFLSKLTRDQLQILYDTLYLADGTGQRRLCGKEKPVFYVTMIQTMLGLPTTFYQQEENCWRTRILHPKNSMLPTNGKCNKITETTHKGTIWCPSIPSKYFVAEREGLMFITGNTESNVRTMVRAVKAGGPEEQAMYRRFWASAITKGLSAVFVANLLLAAFDEDDFMERYKKAWKTGHFRWLDIDITPIYKMLGGQSEARKYFSFFGHFRDPLKFITHPIRSLHHKGSVVYGTFHEAMAGTDWRGQRFTTLSELIGIDDKGVYLTTTKTHKKGEPKGGKDVGKLTTHRMGRKGPIGFEQMPSYIVSQMIGIQPIQIQNFIAMLTGEVAAFDAIARSLGMHTGTTYPTRKSVLEDFVQEYIGLKEANKSIKDLRLKHKNYNIRHKDDQKNIIPWKEITKGVSKKREVERLSRSNDLAKGKTSIYSQYKKYMMQPKKEEHKKIRQLVGDYNKEIRGTEVPRIIYKDMRLQAGRLQ